MSLGCGFAPLCSDLLLEIVIVTYTNKLFQSFVLRRFFVTGDSIKGRGCAIMGYILA